MEFRPRFQYLFQKFPFLPLGFKLDSYWSRLVLYPQEAKRHQGDINHVVDHGYGHLVYWLDPKRTVVTCHDLFLLKCLTGDLPGVPYPRVAAQMFRFYVAGMCKAAMIIADSESTKKDIVRLTAYPEERIRVVYCGVSPAFRKISDAREVEEFRHRFRLRAIPTVLHVASGAPYKNFTAVIKALDFLITKYGLEVELIRVGAPMPEADQGLMHELGLEGHVRYLGDLNLRDLVLVYNYTTLLAHPSLWEGFGWPPLEAMACGTPVVSSNMGSLPEIVGDAGLMVEATDHEGLAEAIQAILTNHALRNQMVEKGLERASKFTWERTAAKLLEVYEAVYRSYTEFRTEAAMPFKNL